MRVLITGGAGFIASHIVDAHIERGDDVTVVDDFSTGSRESLNPKAKLIEGDLNDEATIDAIRKLDLDLVNHHAAQIDVRKSVADPAYDAQLNIVASLRLFEAARACGVQHIIFASSGGASYGEPEFVPQTEEHPIRPMSPYGCAKASVEHYLYFYSAVYGIRYTALRYGNVYGPRQRPDGEAGVVAIFGYRMFAGDEVIINGTGQQTRDYVFVKDVVAANLAAVDRQLVGSFNVGTGVETSVVELLNAMQRASGVSAKSRHAEAKAGEQMRSVLDARRIHEEGGVPPFVEIEDGLRVTMEWLRQSPK
jgi:UDP-glucose 4-epimerase